MKFRFDPDLDFQNKAIQAAVRLFEGAQMQETGFALISQNGVVGNRLTLDDDTLLANLRAVQTDPDLHNGSPVPVSESLDLLPYTSQRNLRAGSSKSPGSAR